MTAPNLNGAIKVEVSDNYAYVATRNGITLVVVDVSSPATPVIVGLSSGHSTTGFAHDLAVRGNYAYVTKPGHSGLGLEIIDISNPTSPSVVSQLSETAIGDSARGIALSGNYAYITTDSTMR